MNKKGLKYQQGFRYKLRKDINACFLKGDDVTIVDSKKTGKKYEYIKIKNANGTVVILDNPYALGRRI